MELQLRCHVCQTRFPPPSWGVAIECPKCGEVIDVSAVVPTEDYLPALPPLDDKTPRAFPKPPRPGDPVRDTPHNP